MGKGLEQTSSKKVYNKQVKKCSISVTTMGMQIKTTVRHHFTTIRMAT